MTHNEVIQTACRIAGVEPGQMMTRSRRKELVFARHLASYYLHGRETLQQIAELTGRENHASVLNSIRKMDIVVELRQQPEYDLLKEFLACLDGVARGTAGGDMLTIVDGDLTATYRQRLLVVECNGTEVYRAVLPDLTIDNLRTILKSMNC